MDDGLSDLLHRVVSLLGDLARRNTDPDGGLSYSQIRLLGALEDVEPATQHRLAQALGVSDPAISRALRPLEEDGLVRVTPDPQHARRRLVELTTTGRATYHANGKPLADTLRRGLQEQDFPYDRYLADTLRLAEILETARAARP
ncbi:MarR family winged helix-turn-helix transcriptional regulator [Streptomyces sp. MBT62]|uniref:MarR family winged helix-turn-helix transcriptional regulator n=1 Tax=Streptomyces sp. MBT62 TaxID=2800410 RepID=UPI00190B0DCA|nr:MarR family transcriptional regulator [Streptomyces sp. MBT62]MBK3567713.1 MarR family transcriptional regulator [Streptomyces sp. MBT62]